MGGRSRVAAQMLAGKGFNEIYNLSGGINAWNDRTAFGPEDQGMSLFERTMSLEDCLAVAYSLEQGLRDFYLSLMPQVQEEEARKTFQMLADIEIKHMDRLLFQYARMTGEEISREEFEQRLLSGIVEGGLTTREYIDRFKPDLNSMVDIISLAMSIEAQALDLYVRAAEIARESRVREALTAIGGEERRHLNELGKLMEASV